MKYSLVYIDFSPKEREFSLRAFEKVWDALEFVLDTTGTIVTKDEIDKRKTLDYFETDSDLIYLNDGYYIRFFTSDYLILNKPGYKSLSEFLDEIVLS